MEICDEDIENIDELYRMTGIGVELKMRRNIMMMKQKELNSMIIKKRTHNNIIDDNVDDNDEDNHDNTFINTITNINTNTNTNTHTPNNIRNRS